MTQTTIPGEAVSLAELQAVAGDGTKLRYALMEMASKIPDAIALGRGDPDLDTPEFVIEAAKAAVANGSADAPTPVAGLPALREAVARKLREQNAIPVDADGVIITNGGQEGIFLIMQALLDPGDEILVPDPRYSSYDQAIEAAGGVMVNVATEPADNFDLLPSAVEAAISPKTKALLIVSPNNPTAGVVSEASLRGIAEVAQKHNLIVISDEIYERYIYEPSVQVSIASLPGMFERTITLNGCSKTYAMTGWRVGFLAAPPEFINVLAGVKSVLSGYVSPASQYAALAALTGPQDILTEYKDIYLRRRQLMMDGLAEMGFTYTEPQGAFFIYTNAASSGLSAFELSYLLLKEGHVLIFPGTAFGDKWQDWLRISLLQPEEEIVEAIRRMKAVIERHRNA
jgi:aminotransferase